MPTDRPGYEAMPALAAAQTNELRALLDFHKALVDLEQAQNGS